MTKPLRRAVLSGKTFLPWGLTQVDHIGSYGLLT
jgi:hypothetical protein